MLRARHLAVLAVFVLAVGGEAASAADELTIEVDLAFDEAATERELPRGVYNVLVRNMIPDEDYRTSSTRAPEVVADPVLPRRTASVSTSAPDRCAEAMRRARAIVAGATSEKEVPSRINRALAETEHECVSNVEDYLLAETTLVRPRLAKVERGSVTTVTVRRVDNDRTWKAVVRTGQMARFAVLPLTGAIWTKGEEYFAEKVQVTGDDGSTSEKFKLVQEEDDALAPVAGIAVLLLRETTWGWPLPDAHGPFVGIGFTSTDPPVGLTFGYSLGWRDHVAFTAGGALVSERHLLGRYRDDLREGILLDTNLTNDQLTRQEPRFRFLAGIAISFGGGTGGSKNAGDDGK